MIGKPLLIAAVVLMFSHGQFSSSIDYEDHDCNYNFCDEHYVDDGPINDASFDIVERSAPQNGEVFSYLTESDVLNSGLFFSYLPPSGGSFGMKTYFQNLYAYTPSNTIGTCGFVSFTQYLSYYDTFYNDDIIPYRFDRTNTNATTTSQALAVSPGVQRLNIPSTNVETFINNNYYNDFQSYLIRALNIRAPGSSYRTAIGMWDYHHLLAELMGADAPSYTTISTWDYGDPRTPAVKSIAENAIKAKLNQGKPVMVHIADIDANGDYNGYHSVVAYYYDASGIHCHFGWGSSSADMVIPASYEITEIGYWDDSQLSFVHSRNYMINELKYCGCGSHIHHTLSSYTPYNSSRHTAYCACGTYSTLEFHYKLSSSQTSNRCSSCGTVCQFLFVKEPEYD
ncbi:MAG: hypothetical protein LKF69_04270 [Bacilli bacterium]|jgi:hypothetical protein|nr:hypothetical protein [Bacilli bacterium]